jgi:hypothetical protein
MGLARRLLRASPSLLSPANIGSQLHYESSGLSATLVLLQKRKEKKKKNKKKEKNQKKKEIKEKEKKRKPIP